MMNERESAIEVDGLVRRYGATEAVNGLSMTVPKGCCYGFFGRNGAGKTTTIKCLLNLLRRDAGTVSVFGMDPIRREDAVKARVAYVPDTVAFYPWMTVRKLFRYVASFRSHWNRDKEAELLKQFRLDPSKGVRTLSRGEKAQVALIGAICAEPNLLLLDEPTSGLDPYIRREVIRTIIGAYQDGNPAERTVFISTHLIGELEGLIDAFTIIDGGKAVLTSETERAKAELKRVRARFHGDPPKLRSESILQSRRSGREAEWVIEESEDAFSGMLSQYNPEAVESEGLTLEEIFLVKAGQEGGEP